MKSSPIKIAIIGALCIIIYAMLLHFIGQAFNRGLTSLSYIIVIATIVFGIYFYKKNDMNDSMTFKEGFWAGFRATLILALIGCLWLVLYIKVVNPDFMTSMKQMQLDQLTKQGLTDEQIDAAMPMMDKFMSIPFMFISGFMMYTLLGTITAAIASAVMKNRNQSDLPIQ